MTTNSPPVSTEIPVDQLHFDPENPRFPIEVASGPTDALIERFIRDERLAEIIGSIADQGYFQGEPLLVVQTGTDHYEVIEGNRRLAALKLLTKEYAAPENRPSIVDAVESAANRPSPVPCLVFSNRDQILRYLGFRHITGIKSWSSLQKARYLKQMREKFFANESEADQLVKLAREIGSRADYVGQMLAALALYDRAERQNFYDIKGFNPDEVEFSVLATALSYTNICEYVGLDSRQDIVGRRVSDDNLKNVIDWLFATRDQRSVIGESRNLKKLAAVVASPDATASLVVSRNLDAAFQLSKGPAEALSGALRDIEKRLKQAWDWLPLVDSPDFTDVDTAERIRKLALDMRELLKSKSRQDDDE